MDDGPMKTEAEDLLNEVQFSAKELLVMDASKRSNHGNAYFTGFGKSRRIVFYDTLLKQLTDKEMRAILAHEIGHFKLRHIYKRIILSFLMSFLGLFILWSLTQLPAFFTMHGVRSMGNAQALLLFSLVGGTYTFLLTPLSSILSRKHEYEADKFASQHALAEDLVTSLLKLYRNNMAFLTSDSAYATFYFSHPSAPERVAHLRSLPSK
jgi:STE24 endopeptidase